MIWTWGWDEVWSLEFSSCHNAWHQINWLSITKLSWEGIAFDFFLWHYIVGSPFGVFKACPEVAHNNIDDILMIGDASFTRHKIIFFDFFHGGKKRNDNNQNMGCELIGSPKFAIVHV